MPGKGKKGTYNYGRKFRMNPRNPNSTMVRYRYVNRDKRTKTLVDARTKKPVNRAQRKYSRK